MKFLSVNLLILFIVSLVAASSQWTKEDYEIFNLNDKIQEDLGKKVTFYSWLGLENGPKSTQQEITKAYRQLSRKLHPDKWNSKPKNQRKKANERFQRLSLVGNILRDQSLKRRYDYFYNKGFPKWKGTGYYYSKFRPGLIFTLSIIYCLVGIFHFVGLRINRKQDYKRLVDLKNEIKNQAWGGSQIPPSDGSDRKIVNESNGKTFLIKPDGFVYLINSEDNDNLVELDENEINLSPGFKESLFFKIPIYFYNLTIGNYVGKPISTNVEYVNKKKVEEQAAEQAEKKKQRKKAKRGGERIELPNGKVVYSRKK